MANYCGSHLADAARLYIVDAGNKAVTVRLFEPEKWPYGDWPKCAYCHAVPQFVLTNIPK